MGAGHPSLLKEGSIMATERQSGGDKVYRLKLTPEQQAALREITGRDGEAIELTAQELEERIAPLHVKSDAIF
jgi:hypothetical protein